jgi:cobalt-precorrin-5B (C1)-methyltransferase
MLVHQITVNEVTIELPGGNSATFSLSGQILSAESASCFVIKDAGDDPDVTNGAEVHAQVSFFPCQGEGNIVISGGKGIGRVTKPGLAAPPGEWAINPVPRRMIEQSVSSVLSTFNIQNSHFSIVISIPDGEERAKKTLNARLGIIGGLSILGTTGIVRPISAKAWTDTLDAALDVAKACGCTTVVLSTGRTSEMAAQIFLRVKGQGSGGKKNCIDPILPLDPIPLPLDPCHLSLPEEAYIMMGDHIAYALRACQQRGYFQPIIACQFAKLLKIACGHENTHAAASDLDLAQLLEWAQKGNLSEPILTAISTANTAREIAIASSFDPLLFGLVLEHARHAAGLHAPDLDPDFLLADYSGNCIFDSR